MGTQDLLTPEWAEEVDYLNTDGWDMYFCINQPNRDFVGIKPKDSDIVAYTQFIVDLDPLTPHHYSINPISDIGFGCQFSAVVYTGNGYQVHYPIKLDLPPIEVGRKVSRFLRENRLTFGGAALHYRVDTSTSDPSRLVRIPNTINWKTTGRGRVEYVESVPLTATLSSYIDKLAPLIVDTPQLTPIPHENLSNLSYILPRLNGTATLYLMGGIVTERHKCAYATAVNLLECGVNKGTALAWMLHANESSTTPLPAEEVAHCVSTAYKSST